MKIKVFSFLLSIFFGILFQRCGVPLNPKLEDCIKKEITVVEVTEGGVKDLVFHEADGSFYYINRGLENDFSLASAEEVVLNKKVTLHVYEHKMGLVESRHITQLEVDGAVLYSEF